MALKLNTPINTFEGMVVNNAYARIEVSESHAGSTLLVAIKMYPSKEVYKNGAQPLNVKKNADYSLLNPITNVFHINYNREADGVDILAIAHQACVDYLSTLGITAQVELD